MARPLTQDESEALTNSGILLRFAAENIKDFPQTIVSTITAAQDAKEANTWDQKTATDFWIAFNSLCALIKPVTIDTLSTNQQIIPPSKWSFWRKDAQPVSLARRSAGRYIFLLVLMLFMTVILSFLVATTNRLNSEIQKLIDSGTPLIDKLVSDVDSLEAIIGQKNFSEAAPAQQESIAIIQKELQQIYYLLDQMWTKKVIMSRLGYVGQSVDAFHRGTLGPTINIATTRDEIRNYYVTRRDVGADLARQSVKAGAVDSIILPIILGIMGACAYVIRLISEQIKDSTFSSTSPIRHIVRVALGGLTGVVIGFVGIVSVGNLSSPALAFIAGYAVETPSSQRSTVLPRSSGDE